MAEKKQRMKVVAFFDGRPGHEKQTKGILGELGRLVDLECVAVNVTRKNLVESILDLAGLIFSTTVSEIEVCRNADLLIGTGTSTHVPMLRMKKSVGVPAVTCMTPASYLRSFFDLCFVPLHDEIAAGGNILTTIGPPNCSRPSANKDRNSGLILIGGVDEKSHRWRTETIIAQVREIVRRDEGMHWTVAASPRTPPETVALLNAISRETGNVDFFPFERTGPGWIEEQYARSGQVWVTADSISMVYEALSAGCRVGLLPVEWKNPSNKFKKSAEYLVEHGLAVVYTPHSSDQTTWTENEPLHEARRCAEEILKRWPPKN